MSDVIVSAGLRVARAQRQARLGALQRLALALLIAAKHQPLIGRVQVKSDHIPKLLIEVFVLGNLEYPALVRFKVIGIPDALYAGVRDSRRFGHGSGGPSLPPLGWAVDLRYHLLDAIRWDRRLSSPSGFIPESCEPLAAEPGRPLRYFQRTTTEVPGDFLLAQARSAQQDNFSSLAIAFAGGRSFYSPLQLLTFLIDKHY